MSFDVDASALVISVMSRMLKSSGSPAAMRCRSCSRRVICLIAAGIAASVVAFTMIWSMFVNRTG